MKRALAALALAAVLGVTATAPGQAADAPPTGRDFGQHVETCAKAVGFSGDHNPGMHQGFAEWDGMTCED